MSVIVTTKNKQEEKVLLTFLDSLNYKYESAIKNEDLYLDIAFLNKYNDDLENADREIESGNFVDHDEVEQLFQKRRKSI